MNYRDMVKKVSVLLFVLACACRLHAAAITNGDFEEGSLNGWNYSYYGVTYTPYVPYALTVTPGTAEFSYGLNMVHSGNYATKLYSGYGTARPYVSIWQDVVIPSFETDLETWFAAVVSGAHRYETATEPDSYVHFEVINLADSTTIYSQKYGYFYNLYQLIPGDPSSAYGPWSYLPWQKMTVSLSSYVGSTLRIKYTAYGCSYSGHYCMGYIDDLRFVAPPTRTFTPTVTPTITPTYTPTVTQTVTQTITPTTTPTYTPTFTVTPTVTNTPVPFAFELKGPFPNPAVNETQLVYWLSREAPVAFKVYTVSGEVVREATDQGGAGYNAWLWDGYNADRKRVASGVFIIRAYATDPIFGGSTPPAFTKAAILR